ncbi:MAG: hypothetical protein V3V15_01160 [Sphingorhabdus sp.]
MKFRLFTALAIFTVVGVPLAQAQFGLGNVVKKVGIPSLSKITSGPKPVSTNIKDAVYGDPTKDGFVPPVAVQQLTGLERTDKGGFVLASGYYEMNAQTYCLKAGTHGPGKGNGYLYAPLKGSAKKAVKAILQNSVAKPEIAQRDIQLLLWAIVARAKFEDLNNRLKITASQLLTKKQLAKLNRNALSVMNSRAFSKLIGGTPPLLRRALTAEADMRRIVTRPSIAYADAERVAVLAGAAPMGDGSIETPSGRWNLHPDGYWVRFMPSGYSRTHVQIWVPQGSDGVGEVYDPATQVAVPGNTSRQRIGQSGRQK